MLRTFVLACLTLTSAWAQENYEALFSTIRANDLAGLKSLLDKGASADSSDGRQITALMYAAETGSTEAMKILLDHGAQVNAKSGFGSTALMWAVTDLSKVKLLLDRGADVNIAGRSGRTALIIASCGTPSVGVVRMLLGKGAQVNAMDRTKVTALNAAAFAGDTATMRVLIDAGAEVDIPDSRYGLTPLMNVAGNRNPEAVQLLLQKGARVNAQAKMEDLPQIKTGTVEFGGWTPLLMAAPFGPTEVVKELVDAGAKVNVQDYRGFTPLALAVATDRYDRQTIRLLLDHGADLTPKTKVDESALDWAYKLGDAQVIGALKGTPKVAPRTVALAEHKPDIRTALGRSMPLLDQTTTRFFKTAACYACHEQTPGEFAAASLRAKGIAVDETASHERRQQIVSALSNPLQLEGPGGLGGSDNAIYSIEGLVRSAYPPDRITEYVAGGLALTQGSDGGWHLPGYSRSPMQDSDFSRTTIALRALKAYGTEGRKAEMTDRIARAKHWLLNNDAVILEDLDWRLVGVAATGSNTEELRKLAAPILKSQRADGGWAQRETFTTDAYATALTLWALAESGVVNPNDDVYRKGVNYLLGTQAADGSWHVASRSTRFQQYFESGFPYEHDQWISTMATGWAINALALAVERN